jgi:hypothetical protein
MQFFTDSVFEEKLESDKGKSLVQDYEDTRDDQALFTAPKWHAKYSTAAHISFDSLLKYIMSARFTGNWRDTVYSFVLHWKEQVSYYEKLELKDITTEQKLRMLKNTVADVADLQSVKHIEDQNIACGKHLLDGKSTWNYYCLHAQTMTSPIPMRVQYSIIYMLPTLHMTEITIIRMMILHTALVRTLWKSMFTQIVPPTLAVLLHFFHVNNGCSLHKSNVTPS